ncbi:MAG: L-ribulose-5-phosphate 4-epimerase [Clostridia bacterium]|nr:L-ribulose-5-phosphate 4-epimerase [Clostridia bacterium]
MQALKETVLKANLDLVKNGLVLYTWGNVSAIDRERGLVVIKPSGVDYDGMTAEDMVVVDLDGNVVEGKYRPSSDTPTHIELYKAHPEIGGVVHTHSTYATARAQSGKPLTAYGTTHADYFYGDVPCTRALTKEEIDEAYEKNTGLVINETIGDKDALAVPAILVKNHGPFAWGKDADDAVYHATVLEEVAKMASITESFNKEVNRADDYLLDKHYNRKHGKNAYYGQK